MFMDDGDLLKEIFKTTFRVYAICLMFVYLGSLKAGDENLKAYNELDRLKLIRKPNYLICLD